MAQLRYLDDAGQLQTKTLDVEHFVVGRAPGCQIVLDDDTISREHIRIDMEPDGRFRVRDMGSRNRSFVNGELATETLLVAGDILRIGDRVLEFLDTTIARDELSLDFLTENHEQPGDCDWIKLKNPVSLLTSQVEQLALLWSDLPLMTRAEDIADLALGQMLLDLQADRGLIALRGESKTDLRPLAHRALRRPSTGAMTAVNQAFFFAPVLQSLAGRYPQTTSKIDAKAPYASTAIVTPLTFRGDVVGVMYIDRAVSKKPFTAAALQYAIAAGAQIGAMLGEASRKLVRSAAREGVAWMTTLRRVQSALGTPIESSDTFDVAAKRFAGRVRCGDFADVIHIDDQQCCGLVVDGGGHGITGIVQATAIRAGLRTCLSVSEDSISDPAPLFNELNRMLASSPTRQVLACTYMGIDTSAGRLTYINAGGSPPLLMVAAGRLVTLDQPSLVLGIDPDYVYEATRVDLPEVFRVVSHTDGLAEATNRAGEALGDQRLHEALLDRDAFAGVDEVVAIIAALWSNHMAGSQPDDDALVLVIGRG
ncbi:MAG: SpoIIE family protein phosphatase [Planctomycetes bacterium]|nr:SpoIIE family protein phosphatase [Planctomycetota bacterium]